MKKTSTHSLGKKEEQPAPKAECPNVLTVGHSTKTIEDFLALLQAHGVTCLADVRTIPRSRHNPQFNTDALASSLKQVGIDYIHLPRLGGLRRTTKASVNTGWRNASFRGFADYMQTGEFQEALADVIRLAKQYRLVLMCAEAVPWRCHRSLIADALRVRGIRAEHIMTPRDRRAHSLTPFAEIKGTKITYPASPPSSSPRTLAE